MMNLSILLKVMKIYVHEFVLGFDGIDNFKFIPLESSDRFFCWSFIKGL